MWKTYRTQIVDIDGLFGFNPFSIFSLPGASSEDGVLMMFRNLLVILLGLLAVAWVVMAIIIAFKFITSLGSPDKIEDALKSLKNLFVGITLMFIFVILLFVIVNIFLT